MPLDEQTGLGNAGAPFSFKWGGRSYTVGFTTQKYKAAVVRAKKRTDARELKELRKELGEEEYQKGLAKIKADSDAGLYAYDGKKVQDFLNTEGGKLARLRALLGEQAEELDDDDLFEMLAEKADEITAFIGMAQAKVDDMLKSVYGFDPAAQEALYRAELGIPAGATAEEEITKVRAELGVETGAEPTPEQAGIIAARLAPFAELETRLKQYGEALDPKALIRCAKAAGLYVKAG